MPYFCRTPLILTDFYAIQTPFVWHILGAYFLQIWGAGVVRIIFTCSLFCLIQVGGFTRLGVRAFRRQFPRTDKRA